MATITIDQTPVEFVAGESVIQAATRQRIEIPHYCWHPRLSVAANCRMCLVEVEKAPKLVPACQTECKEGMVVHTQNDKVKVAQRQVHEFLLINHPIDCPICDQAGECKLQDYYMRYQLTPSRMREPKVYKPKLKRLGPHVMYNAQRCILCTRCVRFMDEVAHDRQLGLAHRGDHSEITTFPGKELDSPYALNTVDVCPVGALTSTVFRFKQRVWNLRRSSSLCPGCAKGCNVRVDQRSSQVYRMLPRENEAVNKSWMCDEGRLTYKWANELRLLAPLAKDGEFLREASGSAAIEQAGRALLPLAEDGSSWGVAVSMATTLEDAWALGKFLREVAPKARVFLLGRADGEADAILRQADRNPNRRGVTRVLAHFGFVPQADDEFVAALAGAEVKAALIVGHDSHRAEAIAQALPKLRASVHITSHSGPISQSAGVSVPSLAWVEQDGIWHNGDDRLQALTPAFAGKPAARAVRDWLGELAQALEHSWQAPASLAVVRQAMGAADGPYAGFNVASLGTLGLSVVPAPTMAEPAAKSA